MRPPYMHRDLPHRSAFSATAFLAGRKLNDKAKTQSMATTTCGNVVSQECKSVSNAQRLVRRSSRDTPRPPCLVQTVKWRTLRGLGHRRM